ncbi:MAG: CTP synthase [Parcubacteria group bacterium GW2011_GWC2_49_9]|nr:MAG: CTP synthase [Parcubacteria group bacterium GW2011_GWA2_48_9]KKW16152.1 MAG: CTP synthase [Parcubacteria group bacterium GW2011_GWC2_49_9]
MSKPRFIFVTGGVCSGLGKGIVAASIGAILKAADFRVFSLKFDPYLNVDPGTMSPYQHGEVYVLRDGTETDLDLGHYERFLDVNLTAESNLTTGQVYQEVIGKERKGTFLGKTIQVIPHITDAIKKRIYYTAESSKADFLIMEIGGTVGDIEGEPFLEAARQLRQEVGPQNALYVHVALLPYLKTSHELKTKPVQASVRELRRLGIQPEIIIARADYPIKKEHLEKIALFCDVPLEAVFPATTSKSIYEVPLNLEQKNISQIIFKQFGIVKKPNLHSWNTLVRRIKHPTREVSIGMVGKYTSLGDAYLSVTEALNSAVYHHNAKMRLQWIDAESLEKKDEREWNALKRVDGIVIPGGFGTRGTEGKIAAAKYARENKVPYLGLCLGMQIATIEFARSILKTKNVNSTEFDPKSANPVIHIMPDQEKKLLKREYGASMRLGSWKCRLVKDSLSFKAYGVDDIEERHRHRYEFNNTYREQLEAAGLRIAGTTPDGLLVEIIEIKDHPWFVGVQFHPEFQSRPLRPHPLFREFVRACLNK